MNQLISVVIPVYNEEDNILPLLGEIDSAMRGANLNYEVIAVDDGSTDGSVSRLEEIAAKDSKIKVVVFRRNFGQTSAFDAGFRNASGNIVITMDADGQNDPADIPRMVVSLNQGADFVAGWRKNRKDSFFIRTLPSKIANFIIRKVTRTHLHDLGCSLKVFKAEIVKELRLYGEMHRYIGVLVENMGAKIIECEVNHRQRKFGVSKYGLGRIGKVLLDLLTVWFLKGFQTKPIYVFGGVGFFLIFVSVIIEAFVAYQKFFLDIYVHRNPLFTLGAISGVLAIQFFGLGILAELLVRTYFESQNKEIYSISRKINF